MSAPAIDIANLSFAWPGHPRLLHIASLKMQAGERLFLQGPSGSGKSTLLGLIAGVLTPTSGQLNILGEDMTALSSAKRDHMRAARLGVIFQIFNLVPYLSVIENITLPLSFSKARANALTRPAADEARRLLGRLGLEDESLLRRRVSDLSVGQQQRVAAARALIGSPDLIIADEPTSALDAETRDSFISLLTEEATRTDAALLFVSHDPALAAHFDRALNLAELNTAETHLT